MGKFIVREAGRPERRLGWGGSQNVEGNGNL